MKRNFILSVAFVAVSGVQGVKAQSIGPSTINSAGGRGTAGGNEFEWSVGEIAYVPTTSLIVTQGVLQPTTKKTSVSSPMLSNNLKVFPNPSSSVVNIEFAASAEGKLNFRLMDVAGKIIINKSADVKAGTSVQQLNIAHLAAASYMLHVSFESTGVPEETVYTIQKLQ